MSIKRLPLRHGSSVIGLRSGQRITSSIRMYLSDSASGVGSLKISLKPLTGEGIRKNNLLLPGHQKHRSKINLQNLTRRLSKQMKKLKSRFLMLLRQIRRINSNLKRMTHKMSIS